MIFNHIYFIFLFSFSCWSQQQKKLLKGFLHNGIDNLSGAHIINKNSNIATYSINDGSFEIYTMINDTLNISYVGYKTKQIIVNKNHLEGNKNSFQLDREIIELDEILVKKTNLTGSLLLDLKKINYKKKVNSKTLNLPNSNNKKLTQAERKLGTASKNYSKIKLKDADLILKYGIDPIINSISGRTRKLRKVLKIEQLQKKIDFIKTHHSNVITKLGIDNLNIDQFIYFLTLDENFKKQYNSENFLNFLTEQSKLYKQLNYK